MQILDCYKNYKYENIKTISIDNKYKELLQKYNKEVEQNGMYKAKYENQIKTMAQMRADYYKEISYIKEMRFRRLAPSKYSHKMEVNYFSPLDSIEESTMVLLNNKLKEMKMMYDYQMGELSDLIEELEAKNKELIQENNSYKKLDLNEINVLMERLKLARNTPKKVWKSFNKIFGPEFIHYFIMQEIGKFEDQLDLISLEFRALNEKTSNQIKNIEFQIKKIVVPSYSNSNESISPENMNLINENTKLQKEIRILTSIIDQKNFLIKSLEEKTYKESILDKQLKNDIFNVLIERFKLNHLIKFHNSSCLLFEKFTNNHQDIECQFNAKDFNQYLRTKNILMDKEIDTQDLRDFFIASSKNLVTNNIKKGNLNSKDVEKQKFYTRNKFFESNNVNKNKFYGINFEEKFGKDYLQASEISSNIKGDEIESKQNYENDTLKLANKARPSFVRINLNKTNLSNLINSEEDPTNFLDRTSHQDFKVRTTISFPKKKKLARKKEDLTKSKNIRLRNSASPLNFDGQQSLQITDNMQFENSLNDFGKTSTMKFKSRMNNFTNKQKRVMKGRAFYNYYPHQSIELQKTLNQISRQSKNSSVINGKSKQILNILFSSQQMTMNNDNPDLNKSK